MKNRPWYCYALDFLGTAALAPAAAGLAAAYWLNGTAIEATMLAVFQYCMSSAVVMLLAARSCEIVRVLRHNQAPAAPVTANLANVESLPQRDGLPRAA